MTKLISETYIKENSPVTDNVDPKDLSSHVFAAQNNFLRPLLGEEFYQGILTRFANQSLTPAEVTLMTNYIQPGLLWRTIANALPWIQYNLRNKGLMINTDDAAGAAGFSEVKFMLNEAAGRAKVYENQMVKYLCDNSKDFPDYTIINNQTNNKFSHTTSGIIFY